MTLEEIKQRRQAASTVRADTVRANALHYLQQANRDRAFLLDLVERLTEQLAELSAEAQEDVTSRQALEQKVERLEKNQRTPGTYERCSKCGQHAPYDLNYVNDTCQRQISDGGVCPNSQEKPRAEEVR